MRLKKADMIIDLSWGSCGKGLIAGYLAETNKPDTLATSWAANAGHIYINGDGRKFLHTMIPNGVVSPNLRTILIGPGSLIDPTNFYNELMGVADMLEGVEILIHPNAAVILDRHREEEAGPMTKIGSTKKGVGAAAIERIRRNPDSNNVASATLKGTPLESLVCTAREYADAVDKAEVLQIEGAQGYGLSLYHGFYPYCTSRDITPHQVLADCGVPYGVPVNVIGTMRTYPIRVANRYDADGKMVGWSGPCYADQEELDWEKDLGIKPEITTVTKLQRRVFSFSIQQAREAIRQCRPNEIFCNFLNYLPGYADAVDLINTIDSIAANYGSRGVVYGGVGPTINDVITLKDRNNYANTYGHDDLAIFYAEKNDQSISGNTQR